MAVAFDVAASATGFGSGSSPLTFTHTAGTGGSVVLVLATVDANTTGVAATYGGASMTLLGSKASDNVASDGIVYLFGITGQTSGGHTVSISSGSGFTRILGNSVSFTGADSFGTAVTAFGSSASASVTISGTTSGNMCMAGAGSGTTGTTTWTSGTGRFTDGDNDGNGVGNITGGTIAAGGSVSLTVTIPNDVWAMVGVEVQAPAGGTSGPSLGQLGIPQRAVTLVSNSGWRGAGHSR